MKKPILSPAIPQLPSGNLEKTATFYKTFLGFEELFRFDSIVSLKRENVEIHFWLTDEKSALDLGSNSSCYIRVQNIETLFKEFQNNGITFRYVLQEMPWGMNEMQIDDPYKNAIRFGESC
jgi:uncharacterized glyoxalase superfamily protein PhnB